MFKKQGKKKKFDKNNGKTLKNGDWYAKIFLGSEQSFDINLFFSSDVNADLRVIFDFINRNTRLGFNKTNTTVFSQKGGQHMANVRDAANHLVRLYYYGNKNCTSAVIQKLLIIAQMKSIYNFQMPLFDDDFLVKPSCFSIEIISNTYPDIIFQEPTREALVNIYDKTSIPSIPDFNGTLPSLSTFYNILNELTEQETSILNDTYMQFGRYNGNCIGKFMQSLSLHSCKSSFEKLSIRELTDYLNNIPDSDKDNEIIAFVFS